MAAALLLAFLALLFVFWREILAVRIAPKAVLYSALTQSIEQLQMRFESSPAALLLAAADPEGRYTADVSIQTYENDLLSADYEMKVQTNAGEHQISADGTMVLPENRATLSCYLDSAFLAVSSDKLGSGKYYGITYSSFSDDIRSIPLLDFFISEKMISQWEDALQKIPLGISEILPAIRIPDLSDQNLEKCILGVLALPCRTERISIPVEFAVWNCDSLVYSAKGTEINRFLQENLLPENSEITATFYLYQNKLVKALVKYSALDESVFLEGFFGLNPSENDLWFTGTWTQNDITKCCTIAVSKPYDNADLWNLMWTEKGSGGTEAEYRISYTADTGRTLLAFAENREPISLYLQRFGDGFQIVIDDVSDFLESLNVGFSLFQKENKSNAVIFVRQGSQIIKPQYKNLDEWSIDDFWTLLTDVGSLLGIQMLS